MEEWNLWPDQVQPILPVDLNEPLQPEINLNLAPDPQEMIVDPLFPPLAQNPQADLDLLQANEMDEETEQGNVGAEMAEENPMQEPHAQPVVQVDIPQLNLPMENCLHHEVQEDELMNNEEL